MITKTFICDVCKKSVGEFDLFKVTTNLEFPKQEVNYRTNHLASCQKDVCRGCLEKKGLVTEGYGEKGKDSEGAVRNQKTFESKFIDFLEDIGVAFVE